MTRSAISEDGKSSLRALSKSTFVTWTCDVFNKPCPDAVKLANSPPLRSSDKEVVVITDPHFNTLKSHEFIGHPTELDRALKMERLTRAEVGFSQLTGYSDRQADCCSPGHRYSDPSLPGFGHYKYDHEGTLGRKVMHIEKGIFKGFMNSRQTAAILGVSPNGSYMGTTAGFVPLIRMSSTVFAAGNSNPADIIGEVDKGYYLVGHRIPSIAESRENFRISAQKVYEINKGQIGQLYRGGGIMADPRTTHEGRRRRPRLPLYPIPLVAKASDADRRWATVVQHASRAASPD